MTAVTRPTPFPKFALPAWWPSLARPAGKQPRLFELGCFAVWLVLVLALTARHALWRDEVRALTIALQGNSLPAAWLALHGEGHPALWYLMLRGLHAIVASPSVLPVAAIGTAAATVLLLVLRSPFSRWLLVLMLLGGPFLFEYSVMERNYGISVLLLFIIAVRYPRDRDGGPWLGLLLFLLANTNVHSVVLVAAFLLFWLVDLVSVHGLRPVRPLRWFAVNVAIATLGVAACVATVYPPYNDAVMSDGLRGSLPVILGGILSTGWSFDGLIDTPAAHFPETALWSLLAVHLLLSVLLYVSVLGLVRSPGAVVAGLAALLGLSAFFTVVYSGGYRHEGLWLAFMIALYWIVLARQGATAAPRIAAVGSAAMVLLLVLQLPSGARPVVGLLLDRPPLSRARDVGALIAARPGLKDAIVIGEPESVIEALPYYASNPTYMLRQSQFGSVVKFSKSVRLDLNLGDVLAAAKTLAAHSGEPVLILMEEALEPGQATQVVDDGYGRTFTITPAEVQAFLANTKRIAHFGPAQTDETYDVYQLDPSTKGSER